MKQIQISPSIATRAPRSSQDGRLLIRLLGVFIGITLALNLGACGGGGGDSETPSPNASVGGGGGNTGTGTGTTTGPVTGTTTVPVITPTGTTTVPVITPTGTTTVPVITPTGTTTVPVITPTGTTTVPVITGTVNPNLPPVIPRGPLPEDVVVLTPDQSGCSVAETRVFHVGQTAGMIPEIKGVPWSTLKGCDTVFLHAKTDDSAYHEMILLSAGTALTPSAPNKFMRLVGVVNPLTGRRPILDGANATQLETLPGATVPTMLRYYDTFSTPPVLYKYGVVMVSAQLGRITLAPAQNISIENLEVRNVVYNQPFVKSNPNPTATSVYSAFSSCVFVEIGKQIVIKDNELHNCGNGLFVNSKNGVVHELSENILVDGNRFYDNGNPVLGGGAVSGGFSEHNSYTEARGAIFQNNFFGDMRPGANGDCIKDRSSGTIIRYNTFRSNCGLQLHLMDPTGGGILITGAPNFDHTYVYGNLFDIDAGTRPATSFIRYGGDSWLKYLYRSGTLHFYNNTVVVKGNQANTKPYADVSLFFIQETVANAEVKNNVIASLPQTGTGTFNAKIMAVARGGGTTNLTNNWITANASQRFLGQADQPPINGWTSNISPAANDPLFLSVAARNFRPATGSTLIGAGADISALSAPTREPASLGPTTLPRAPKVPIDIGAFAN
jgi:hypothetical protein